MTPAGRPAALSRDAPGVRPPGTSTVLVVEDDAETRDLLKNFLEIEGFTVRLAADGREGLARLHETPLACVVLLDLMMPVMDGWQFRRAQQADELVAGIPVVVVSAVGARDRVEGLQAAAYLPKPIDLDRLLATIDQICG
jgi:DNA-binding response OmpR family regulator